MTRRTFRQIEASDVIGTIVAERAGVLALARTHCAQADALARRGRMSADEAGLLNERLRAFADAVAQGLHVAAPDGIEVRHAMRDVVRADAAAREAGEGA